MRSAVTLEPAPRIGIETIDFFFLASKQAKRASRALCTQYATLSCLIRFKAINLRADSCVRRTTPTIGWLIYTYRSAKETYHHLRLQQFDALPRQRSANQHRVRLGPEFCRWEPLIGRLAGKQRSTFIRPAPCKSNIFAAILSGKKIFFSEEMGRGPLPWQPTRHDALSHQNYRSGGSERSWRPLSSSLSVWG